MYLFGHLANIAHRNYSRKYERNMDASVNTAECFIIVIALKIFVVS